LKKSKIYTTQTYNSNAEMQAYLPPRKEKYFYTIFILLMPLSDTWLYHLSTAIHFIAISYTMLQ